MSLHEHRCQRSTGQRCAKDGCVKFDPIGELFLGHRSVAVRSEQQIISIDYPGLCWSHDQQHSLYIHVNDTSMPLSTNRRYNNYTIRYSV